MPCRPWKLNAGATAIDWRIPNGRRCPTGRTLERHSPSLALKRNELDDIERDLVAAEMEDVESDIQAAIKAG